MATPVAAMTASTRSLRTVTHRCLYPLQGVSKRQVDRRSDAAHNRRPESGLILDGAASSPEGHMKSVRLRRAMVVVAVVSLLGIVAAAVATASTDTRGT